jgi:hypothetical protein
MRSATAISPRPWIAMSTVLFAASMALAGCGAVTTPPSPAADAPSPTPTTAAGYVYEDPFAGYAVTFPGEPSVGQLEIAGTDRTANLVGYGDASTVFYISRGEIRESQVDLRNELFGWLGSVELSGQVGANSDELDGLPAMRAEFTMSNDKEATTIVAGEGDRFYQLIAMGGTPEERQAFVDSFELLD